ncbi:MAG: TolC family protein [Acidobacteria bacterium]|nr:TolC family protein [Acidobacteriota bacterium]
MPKQLSHSIFVLAILVSAFANSAQQTSPSPSLSARYLDASAGKSADDMVAAAIGNNAELEAMRKEVAAAAQLIRQAGLRANPALEISGTQMLGGGDNVRIVQGELPLELGGRRAGRIKVAQAELAIREQAAAERERQLSAEVRSKFGESLAAIFKLSFVEDLLALAEQNYTLTTAKVDEGRLPPLERNQELVELNRIRAERETAEGAVEIKLFELRNLAGMKPEDPLRLKGTLDTPLDQLPPIADATIRALQTRPDLLGARTVEQLAAAKVEQARSQGRFDADLMLGYQRMKSGFPLLGIEPATGALTPIDSNFHFFTFGVKLMLPVRDRKQGEIGAALFEEDAARSRREFGELTIRREVASAYARFERATKAREIYKLGVRDQALANLAVVRQTYELGSKTLLDYIAEHHRYIDTENGYIDALLDAYLARVEVLRAANAPELVNK